MTTIFFFSVKIIYFFYFTYLHVCIGNIEKGNETFAARVSTYEASLMDELQATAELYELHYNPVLREVNELEQNFMNMLRIAKIMFSHLNVFDPIDIRRLQMKCKSENLLKKTFHIKPKQFLQWIFLASHVM